MPEVTNQGFQWGVGRVQLTGINFHTLTPKQVRFADWSILAPYVFSHPRDGTVVETIECKGIYTKALEGFCRVYWNGILCWTLGEVKHQG